MLLTSGLLLLSGSLVASDTGRQEWRTKMQSITPLGYVARRADAPLQIDGRMDEAAWARAPWTSDFVDIEGSAKPAPRLRTRAKLLWDDEYLYVAAEIEDPDVWATLTRHDSVIFQDPDFEVFIDPDGDTHRYLEFEINALNTGWDLELVKPYQDGGPPRNERSIPGLKTAVKIDGTLNQPGDQDRGWTVELAFPWSALTEHARHPGPPTEGEQWRINFSRVQWRTTVVDGTYRKVPATPEDNWVWSPQGVIDMHRPEMWGVVQFTRRADETPATVAPIPGKPARDRALEIYYAQRDYFTTHRRWAETLGELAAGTAAPASDFSGATMQLTADGYVASVPFDAAEGGHVWRIRQDRQLKRDEALTVETEEFVRQAETQFGAAGRRAAEFLVGGMPPGDRATLSVDFLLENLRLALATRDRFPWAKRVPDELFLNAVLPYASLDEPRDPWRAELSGLAAELVQGCTTATEAAQALNRELFNRLGVHYNLGRKRNNQSPRESIEQGKATCTGLSILLVDACRAVGIPARIVGVPEWVHKEGNHTWVEIWDGDWAFTGADEYNAEGLNRGWFVADAALTARSPEPFHQVYATSWKATGQYFPLAWDRDAQVVPAVNVSARYVGDGPPQGPAQTVVHVRLFDRAGGERVPAQVELYDSSGRRLASDRTRAGTADLNDMPAFKLPDGAVKVRFRFWRDGQAREAVIACAACANSHTLDFFWDELVAVPPAVLEVEAWLAKPAAERGPPPATPLGREEASRVLALLWTAVGDARASAADQELEAKQIVQAGKTLAWLEQSFGTAPVGQRTLWITLHGGGDGPAEMNDRSWRGYFGRYALPPGSINVAPRAPTNTWNMWHEAHVDPLLDQLIADFVLRRGVDPNRVFLLGYSAGGDGVYQLAPRLADRFAGAAMMAGHPNETTPEGLRNLPFFLYMGGEDSAFNRNVVVREFSAKLDALQAADAAGYPHRLTVFPGLGHHMQYRESEVILRLAPLVRAAWPKRVVWKQDDVTHDRFYWLARPAQAARAGELYAARVEGQVITVEAPVTGRMTLRLSDELLDLDQPVQVIAGGRTVFEGRLTRTSAALYDSLAEREDPTHAASVVLPVAW